MSKANFSRQIKPPEQRADDRRTAAMAVAGLLEWNDFQHLLRPPRKYRPKRKPSLARAIRTARKAGLDKGTVTVGDVSVTFGESDPAAAVNPWLADLDKVLQ